LTEPTSVHNTLLQCPECGARGDRIYLSGTRNTKHGVVQRFLCRDCGYRFSERKNSKADMHVRGNCQLGAIPREAKKLDSATEKKTVAGDLAKLPQETRGLIAKYMAYLEREGYYENTSYLDLIKTLDKDDANLFDPEDVKTKIARHKWKDSVKMLAVYAYDAFCRMEKIEWTKPKYRQQDSLIEVPDEKDLDALIASTYSKRMMAFLQTLKETYADPGEILRLEWREVKGNIITINHPVKGHLPGQYEVSSKLIAMLNALPKDNKRVFPVVYRNMHKCLRTLRKRAAHKLQNPQLLEISFKSFRHWGGSMLAHYTNGNVLTIKKMLRHKNIQSTMKYIHTLRFEEEDFEETTAITPEEIRKLGKEGWQKYDEGTFNGTTIHFYRKPKRFGGLQ
jgi:integrase